MKIAFLVMLLLTGTFYTRASYRGTFLPELVEKSDLVLVGKIVQVHSNTFKISISKVVKGIMQFDTLSILKFENWTCASRYCKYEVGQEGIFCLEKQNGLYRTMGAANEGELVVIDKEVLIEDNGQKIFTPVKYDFISPYQNFIKLDLQTVVDGIKTYMANLEIINKEIESYYSRTIVSQSSFIEKNHENKFLILILDQKHNLPVNIIR